MGLALTCDNNVYFRERFSLKLDISSVSEQPTYPHDDFSWRPSIIDSNHLCLSMYLFPRLEVVVAET